MPKTVRGIFRNGHIEFLEEPEGIDNALVLVTFLTEADMEGLDTVNLSALRRKRDDILRLAERYGVSNIRVFGSVVRGDANVASDADFLVDVEPRRSLLDILDFKRELRGLLGCPVDVIESANLKEHLRSEVLREATPL